METQTIHAEGIVADFVNKYETIIEPNLKKGNLEVTPVIADVCARYQILEKLNLPLRSDIYAKYRMAIQYLSGLIDKKDIRKGTLEIITLSVNRYVAEIDFSLGNHSEYKSIRRIS